MKIKDLYSLIVFRCFSSFSRPFLFLSFLFLFLVLSPFNNTFVGCVNPFSFFFSLESLQYICWMCKSVLFLFLVLSPFYSFVGCVNPFSFFFLVLSPFYTCVGWVNPFSFFFSLESLLFICLMCKSFLFLFQSWVPSIHLLDV